MRLGGPVFVDASDPDRYCASARADGYGAIFCPIEPGASDSAVKDLLQAVAKYDLVIAETGAWSNPISPDPVERKNAVDKCKASLALAERVGARCCVNIAGSCGSKWDGPDARDLTRQTFDLIVQSVRDIVDAVRPTRTFYALETMPWMYPDSPDSYLDLIKAIDRPGVAVHLDPVNLVNSPTRFFNNGQLIRECFAKLGPMIKSCHGKDIALRPHLTVHLDEVRPGTGSLNYGLFLTLIEGLGPDTPLMLEHLPNPEEYGLARDFVRAKAGEIGVTLR